MDSIAFNIASNKAKEYLKKKYSMEYVIENNNIASLKIGDLLIWFYFDYKEDSYYLFFKKEEWPSYKREEFMSFLFKNCDLKSALIERNKILHSREKYKSEYEYFEYNLFAMIYYIEQKHPEVFNNGDISFLSL